MTRIGIGTALSLRSAQSARLHELVKLPIRALLSWRIRELCCGNDAYFRASHFPGDSCVAARFIGPEVTAFPCASRQVRRANRWSMDHRRGIELYARLHRVSSFPYGTRVCEAVGRLGRRRSLLGGCMPRQRSAISAERLTHHQNHARRRPYLRRGVPPQSRSKTGHCSASRKPMVHFTDSSPEQSGFKRSSPWRGAPSSRGNSFDCGDLSPSSYARAL